MPSARLPLGPPLRRRTGLTALVPSLVGLLAASALTGCGSATSGEGGSGAGSSGATVDSPAATVSPSVTAAPTGGDGPTYPVVLVRTGGLAGYADRLSVASTGTVTGATRAGVVSCTLPQATADILAAAPAPTPPPRAGSDVIGVVVRRGTEVVDLGEGQGGDPLSEAARALLDDVQQPANARTVCR